MNARLINVRHLFLLAMGCLFLWGGKASAQSASNVTYPAGSLIIPMDNTLAATSGGQENVLRSYGLIYYLLLGDVDGGIPVNWAFSTSKTHDGTDFSVAADAVARQTGANPDLWTTISASIDYKGSEFIIAPVFRDRAMAIINWYNTTSNPDVSVHKTNVSVTAPIVYQNISDIPRPYVFSNTGDTSKVTKVLRYAGIPSSAVTAVEQQNLPDLTTGSGICYSVVMIPHDDMTATTVTQLGDFLDDGGNVYVQCHAIYALETDNHAHIMASTDILSVSEAKAYMYPDEGAQNAVGQFMGDIGKEGGSVDAWALPTGGSFNTGYIPIARGTESPYQDKSATIRYNNDATNGWVTYQGGHEYASNQINLCRVMLNAFLLPVNRVSCNILPVEMTTFSAFEQNGAVQLRWKTVTEKNNFGFDVERRPAGGDWATIGFVMGNGTSAVPHTYAFEDHDGAQMRTTLHYRLKQVDRDGKATYSPVIQVLGGVSPSTATLVDVFPNPAAGTTSVSYRVEETGLVTIAVYDMLGREQRVAMKDQMIEVGYHSQHLDLSGMTPGLYYVMLKSGSRTATAKMVIGK